MPKWYKLIGLLLFLPMMIYGQTQIGTSGGGGGGGNPAGNNGDLQDKNGASFAASHINDNGTVLNHSIDSQMCGPNPVVDIRCFGVRVVNPTTVPAAVGCTATINLGTPTIATLNSTCNFMNGDNVVIYGAGTANGMSTPAAPTVTPSLAAAPTNTGFVVSSPAVNTVTTCYKYVARSKAQGLTAASTETCVNSPTLGQRTLAATGEQLGAANSVTVTTAARSPEILAVGMYIKISGTTNDALFGGRYLIDTIPNNTTFTYQTPSDSKSGASITAGTGGTIVYWVSNHIAFTLPSAPVWQYYLYSGASGVETLLIPSKEITNTNLNTTATYMVVDDYGSPYTTRANLPQFVPVNAPGSATPNSLVTKIVSGAGTTTITLNDAATTAVTNATILLDSAVGTVAAFAAQAATKGMIYYPAGCCIVYNSIADTSPYNGIGVSVAGTIYLNDTLVTQNMWHGDLTPAYLNTPQFGLSSLTTINIVLANPGIVETIGNFYGFLFQVAPGNGYSGVYINGGSIPTAQFENVAFTGGGGADYSGILYTQFSYWGNSAGVGFRNLTMNAAATSETPAFVTKNFGEVIIDGYIGSGRGFFVGNTQTVGAFTINGKYETQGPSMPIVTAQGPLALYLNGLGMDTGSEPAVVLLSNIITVTPLYVGLPSNSIPRLSGLPPLYTSNVNYNNVGSTIGLLNSSGFLSGSPINDGTFDNTPQTVQYDATHRAIGAGYSLFTVSTTQPAAPVCTVVTAGPPFTPAGTYTFSYFPIYSNGGAGLLSATSNGCTPNGTSQQVNITIPSIPGATLYRWYYQGNNRFPGINGVDCSIETTLLSFNLEGISSCGSNSLPVFPGGGPAGIVNSPNHQGIVWGLTGQFQNMQSIGIANVTGCSLTNLLGGNSAGSFKSGTTGTCTVTITPGITANNGFACHAKDLTTPADEPKQTAYTTTTATLSWITVTGDLVTWSCIAF
jgi:hypothetical protein